MKKGLYDKNGNKKETRRLLKSLEIPVTGHTSSTREICGRHALHFNLKPASTARLVRKESTATPLGGEHIKTLIFAYFF